MSFFTRHRRCDAGIALIMAIIITAVCIIIVTGLMQYVISDYRASHLDWRRVQALYCAEAGIERAVQALQADADTTSISESALSDFTPEAEGTFEVTISPVPNDPIGAKQIVAIGYVPNKAACTANPPTGVSRQVSTIYAGIATSWDFGMDAIRSRKGVKYGSNDDLTVVVDETGPGEFTQVTDTTVNASIRVTGTGATIGSVTATAANKASVAGDVVAPGRVDIAEETPPFSNRGNDSAHYLPDAFPPNELLGFDAWGNLSWPPAGPTIANTYYQQALAGGTIGNSQNITGSKFVELSGGTFSNARLTGPGTVFIHGNLGNNVVNGSPPVTLVVTGNFTGNIDYTCHTENPSDVAPPLICFGTLIGPQGSPKWILRGPLYALNPNSTVKLPNSAISFIGAVIANGEVDMKSSKARLCFPKNLSGQHNTLSYQRAPAIVSYAAQ